MPIKRVKKYFDCVYVIEPEVYHDNRGYFMEAFKLSALQKYGIIANYVQENHSRSKKNVVRGLHFQWNPPMGKLMRVTRGKAYMVAVDIRKNSPTFGKWFGIEVSEENKLMVWAPAGFARGFETLSEMADVQYLVTGEYNPDGESGILWNDNDIKIDWHSSDPIVSDKDKKAQTLSEWLKKDESNYFTY